jgi:murein DD-endopeptidase MepM/ murein hydrolase activator NlpD
MLSRAGIGLVICAALLASGCETFRPQTDVRSDYESELAESKPVARNGRVELRVKPGQTLSGIARQYNTTPKAIADASGLSDPDTVVAGERLIIPAGRASASPSRKPQPQLAQTNYRPNYARSDGIAVSPLDDVSTPTPTPRQNPVQFASLFSPPSSKSSTPNRKTKFDWPVEGRLLVNYGPRASGGRSDGINIAAQPGETVRAAADGVVSYTGSIKSYGKIVLIRHSGGYVTTYAHVSEIRVRKGDRVTRGQTIALAGASGNVDQPQVHFEIRRDGDPVDPRKFLVALN